MYENNRDQVEGKKTLEKENFLSAVEHREKKSHIKPDKKNKKKRKLNVCSHEHVTSGTWP
jgi:hypothetical protein